MFIFLNFIIVYNILKIKILKFPIKFILLLNHINFNGYIKLYISHNIPETDLWYSH